MATSKLSGGGALVLLGVLATAFFPFYKDVLAFLPRCVFGVSGHLTGTWTGYVEDATAADPRTDLTGRRVIAAKLWLRPSLMEFPFGGLYRFSDEMEGHVRLHYSDGSTEWDAISFAEPAPGSTRATGFVEGGARGDSVSLDVQSDKVRLYISPPRQPDNIAYTGDLTHGGLSWAALQQGQAAEEQRQAQARAASIAQTNASIAGSWAGDLLLRNESDAKYQVHATLRLQIDPVAPVGGVQRFTGQGELRFPHQATVLKPFPMQLDDGKLWGSAPADMDFPGDKLALELLPQNGGLALQSGSRTTVNLASGTLQRVTGR